MGFNFDDLLNEEVKFEGGLNGKKIMVYGSNNLGKTNQCSKLADGKVLLIATESGASAVKCPKVPCMDWRTFKEVVNDMTKSSNVAKRLEQVRVIVVDTAENLVALSERAICNQFGVSDLSEITGKQNGYKLARTDFETQINKLCSVGYCVVFIAHEERVTRTDELTGEEYVYIQPKGTSNEKGSMRMLRDLCDFTIYLKSNGVDRETYKVIPSSAICVETKNVFARSRFDMVSMITPFTAKGLENAIEEAVKRSAETEDVDITDYFSNKKKGYGKDDYVEIIKPLVTKLWSICPDDVNETIMKYLGKKVTDATEEDLVALDNIYNALVTKCTLLGIEY